MWLPNWKFCRVWGSNPGQTMADFFFGLFVGFLDFLVAPFSRFWYYISVQWSKMYLKHVIILIAWFGHIYDHCALTILSNPMTNQNEDKFQQYWHSTKLSLVELNCLPPSQEIQLETDPSFLKFGIKQPPLLEWDCIKSNKRWRREAKTYIFG